MAQWIYLFSSFKILRNFWALLSVVFLTSSSSLAAASSLSFIDFFNAANQQSTIAPPRFKRTQTAGCAQIPNKRSIHSFENATEV